MNSFINFYRLLRCLGALLLIVGLSVNSVAIASQIHIDEIDDNSSERTVRIAHAEYIIQVSAPSGNISMPSLLSAEQKFTVNGVNRFFEPFFQLKPNGEPKTVDLDYQLETSTSVDGSVIVTLRTQLKQATAGLELEGVVLRRRLVIHADKPAITLELSLENPTDQLRYVNMGLVNQFKIDPNGLDKTFVPTTRQVLSISKSGLVFDYYTRSGAWEYEPVAGWIAVNDQRTKRGLVFIADYNWLEGFYIPDRQAVIGWQMDGGVLRPGETWKTTVKCIPIAGFKNITHASGQIVADVQLMGEENRTKIGHLLWPVEKLGKLTIHSATRSLPEESEFIEALPVQIEFDNSLPRLLRSTTYANIDLDQPTLTSIRISDSNSSEIYWHYSENGHRAQPIPALRLAVFHQRPMPEQKRVEQVLPPELKPQRHPKTALLYYGVYTQHYQLQEALPDWNIKLVNAPPARAASFPSPLELDTYAAIILSNVDAGSLPSSFIRRLKRYVEAGGGLFILGGPYAYGVGRYDAFGFDAWLPVATKPFDLQPVEPYHQISKVDEHDIARSLEFPSSLQVFWSHHASAKPESTTVLQAEADTPLLVVGSLAQGRIACFLGTPLGESEGEYTAIWRSPVWPVLIRNTMQWLTTKED